MTSSPPPGYPRVSPYLNYEDTEAMLAWLARAFGLVERHTVRAPDGKVMHAEMTLEEGLIMLGSPGGDFRNPKHLGQVTHSLYVYIDDPDAHCERARKAGAEILEEPADQPYGDRRYGARDPEGHHWFFAMRLDSPASGE
jgi:PhnB protein